MDGTEHVVIGEQHIDVPHAKSGGLTLMVKSKDILEELEFPERLMIDDEKSFYHLDRLQKFHPETPAVLAEIFKLKIPEDQITPEWARALGAEVRHAAGRIDLTLALTTLYPNLPIGWKTPEDHMHPAQIGPLTDFIVKLAQRLEAERKQRLENESKQ